jgi:hypothetical protein
MLYGTDRLNSCLDCGRLCVGRKRLKIRVQLTGISKGLPNVHHSNSPFALWNKYLAIVSTR